MAEKRKTQDPKGFVVVAFADSMEQANEHKRLLELNDIQVIIKEPEKGEAPTDSKSRIALEIGNPNKFRVMVPEERLDEAHLIIESQDAYDDLSHIYFDPYDMDEEPFNDDF